MSAFEQAAAAAGVDLAAVDRAKVDHRGKLLAQVKRSLKQHHVKSELVVRGMDKERAEQAAVKIVEKLPDDASIGGPGSLSVSAQPLVSAKTKASSATPVQKANAAATISQADLARAEKAGRDAERKRWATVFASSGAQGREQACVAALTAANNYTADQIISILPKLPLDASVVADLKAERSQAAARVWDRATNAGDDAKAAAVAGSGSASVWDAAAGWA